MKRSSKKLMVISTLCILAILGVMYTKFAPRLFKNTENTGTLTAIYGATNNSDTIAKLEQKVNLNPEPTASSSENLTSKISQNFVFNYLTLDATGELTPEKQAELINSLSNEYSKTSRTALSLSDIFTFSDREKDKVYEFGNAVAKTVIIHFPKLNADPIALLAEAEQTNATSSAKDKLDAMAKEYRLMALDLQKIPAPASVASHYLGVINGYVYLADDLDNMNLSFTDPARGFIGVSNYQKDIATQINLLKNIKDYFDSNGILFSNTEEGAIWSSFE